MTLLSKLKKIKLIISDVDGVLTDGRIYFDSEGKEMKVFTAKDSFRIEIWRRNGGRMLWFTGRKSEGTIRRAQELDVDLAFKQDIGDDLFSYIKKKYKVRREEILYVGDDWNDIYYMMYSGVSAAPADASSENKKVADIVTIAKGGDGVLAKIIEKVMRAQGTWEKFTKPYFKKFVL